MSASLEVEIRDNVSAKEALQLIVDALGTKKPIYKRLADPLLESTNDRYLAEISPDGTPWKPLSPEYLASSKKSGASVRYPTEKLLLTGRMFGSLGVDYDDESLVVGTFDDVYYAKYNQKTRPFLGLSDSDKTFISDEVINTLIDLIQ